MQIDAKYIIGDVTFDASFYDNIINLKFPLDEEVRENSNNAVTSGAVYRDVRDTVSKSISDGAFVSYKGQTLTEMQKSIARDNIQAVSPYVLSSYVKKEGTKVLSEANFTHFEKDKLSKSDYGAQVNKIENITLNGKPLAINGKSVDVKVHVHTDSFTTPAHIYDSEGDFLSITNIGGVSELITKNGVSTLCHTGSELKLTVCKNANLLPPAPDKKLGVVLSSTTQRKTSTVSTYQSVVVRVKPSTTYTLSGDFTRFADNTARVAFYSTYPEVDVYTTNYRHSTTAMTFTTGASDRYVMIWNPLAKTLEGVMLCEGASVPSEYMPYDGVLHSIKLTDENGVTHTLCESDYLNKSSGTWALYKVSEQVAGEVADGTLILSDGINSLVKSGTTQIYPMCAETSSTLDSIFAPYGEICVYFENEVSPKADVNYTTDLNLTVKHLKRMMSIS